MTEATSMPLTAAAAERVEGVGGIGGEQGTGEDFWTSSFGKKTDILSLVSCVL